MKCIIVFFFLKKKFILQWPFGNYLFQVLWAQASAMNGFLVRSTLRPRVDRTEGVNEVSTQIKVRNLKYSTLVEGVVFTRACVRSLGMEMGRCQAPNLTRPVGWPPLIVFQILIPSKGLLICYSILAHTIMHLKSKHDICPTLIHSIKPFHSSNTYISKAVALTRHLIKHIQSFKHSVMAFINQRGQSSCSEAFSYSYT